MFKLIQNTNTNDYFDELFYNTRNYMQSPCFVEKKKKVRTKFKIILFTDVLTLVIVESVNNA